MNSNVDILTTAEAAELARAEAVIKDGMTAFMAVGTALLRIQQKRLYRATHDTFETYLRERWSISRTRGYEMIAAADTIGQMSAIADTSVVTNEAQARELVTITRMDGIDAAAAVLAEVVDAGPVTAKAIREAHQQDVDDHHVVVDDDEQPAAPASAPVPQPQRKPRRRPITDQLRDAADDYRKAARRLAKLTADDRFGDDHHWIVTNAIVDGDRDLREARDVAVGTIWIEARGAAEGGHPAGMTAILAVMSGHLLDALEQLDDDGRERFAHEAAADVAWWTTASTLLWDGVAEVIGDERAAAILADLDAEDGGA